MEILQLQLSLGFNNNQLRIIHSKLQILTKNIRLQKQMVINKINLIIQIIKLTLVNIMAIILSRITRNIYKNHNKKQIHLVSQEKRKMIMKWFRLISKDYLEVLKERQ
jgi:hypothetical protein